MSGGWGSKKEGCLALQPTSQRHCSQPLPHPHKYTHTRTRTPNTHTKRDRHEQTNAVVGRLGLQTTCARVLLLLLLFKSIKSTTRAFTNARTRAHPRTFILRYPHQRSLRHAPTLAPALTPTPHPRTHSLQYRVPRWQ